jgi:hypothetical protein
MLVKRLDEGTFPIVHSENSNTIEITHRELASLLAHADFISSVPMAS